MNERERWIVYPLIFFLLLLVTRDNILKTQEVKCNRLVCNKLYVETEDGRKLVTIFGKYDRGLISCYGPIEDSIDHERWTEGPGTERNAQPVVQIGVRTGGGFGTFLGRPDAPVVNVGQVSGQPKETTPVVESRTAGASSTNESISSGEAATANDGDDKAVESNEGGS
jgi:hypothetical protein